MFTTQNINLKLFTTMKKILFGALALMVAVSISSCGSSKATTSTPAGMVEEVVPLSGPQYRSNAEFYRAVQNGASTDRGMAQKVAMQNCRQELAANIQADVQQVIENYAKNQNTGVATEYKTQYQELAYTVISQRLSDVQIVDEKMFREADGTFRYYVCMQSPKVDMAAAIEEAIANDAKLNLEFDREQFKKIYMEQMAAFAQ